MHREFIKLVSETVDEAHVNGINLFYESLEHTISKEKFITENTLEETLTMLFNESKQADETVDDIQAIE